MRSVISSSVILGGVLCAIGLFSSPVSGQQVTTGVNNVGVGHSFNENFGVGFNAQFGGGNVVGFLNNPGGVQSPFGGFNPGAGANGGFQFGGNGFSGNLNFSLGQGSGTTLTSTSASVTTMNGQPGMISDQVQVPFVLGVTPIVNGRFYHPTYGMLPRPLTMPPAESPFVQRYRRLNGGGGPVAKPKNHAAPRDEEGGFDHRLAHARESSAGQGSTSVAEIQRQQESEQRAADAEVLGHFQHGQKAEADGKIGAAKVFYRMAARGATGDLKKRVQQRLDALSTTSK